MTEGTTDKLSPEHPADRGDTGVMGIRAGLALALLGALGLPVVGVVVQLVQGWSRDSAIPTSETPLFVWSSVWNTALYPTLIGVLATAAGLPVAWTLRRAKAWWVALVGVPLLLPSYLAYAAWGMLRGPGSWVGDWLAHGSPARALVFDKALAIFGLAMWAWPIGAFVVGAAARRVPRHLLDALDLEPGSRVRKWRVIGGMLAGSMWASVGLIALLMMGSAVPLHLAQVETYVIHLWLYLNSTSDRGTIWPAAAPIIIIAAVAGWIVLRALDRERTEVRDEGSDETAVSPLIWLLAAGVWGLSVIVPIGLFLANMKHVASLGGFWRTVGSAVWVSGRNGMVVGLAVAAIALGVWAVRACGRRGRGGARFSTWAMLTAAFVPGILIGSATLAFWNMRIMPRAAGDSMWPVVFAHIGRFGFLGAAAGWWLAGQETADERGARLMLAGNGIRAWASLCVWPQVGAIVGVGLAGLALSLHEIESTVLLQPPGPSSLAQYMLDKLHYNRNEELCAACVNLMGTGIVLAVLAGWLIGRAGRLREGMRRVPDPR